jgi:hypothetical protein
VASNLEGTRIYLVWENEGSIVLAISTDFGDLWSTEEPVAPGAGQTNPAVAVREEVVDEGGNVVVPETVLIAWEQGGRVYLARYLPGTDTFEAPLDVAAGGNPDVAVGPSSIHLAFENGGAIFHSGSPDGGQSFLTPLQISGSTTMAHAPSAAVNDFTGDVYVAWDALLGAGDSNIYFAASTNDGESFDSVVRVDDDPMGQNQLNVSIAVDERSQKIYATWEDRRGGANVYFTWSEDWSGTWEPNVDVGAGLGGDQFRPQTVVDVARNVYVAFHDTTDGQRVVFSRFNSEGTFDPPLAPSTEAGAGGIVGDNPTVATDRYGAVYVAWEENRGGPTTDIFFARAE